MNNKLCLSACKRCEKLNFHLTITHKMVTSWKYIRLYMYNIYEDTFAPAYVKQGDLCEDENTESTANDTSHYFAIFCFYFNVTCQPGGVWLAPWILNPEHRILKPESLREPNSLGRQTLSPTWAGSPSESKLATWMCGQCMKVSVSVSEPGALAFVNLLSIHTLHW